LVFHVIGSLLGDLTAVVALNDAEREINSGRKSARGSQVSILDEPGSAPEVGISY
jgi:hypothetical protein